MTVGASEHLGQRIVGSPVSRLVRAGKWPVSVVPRAYFCWHVQAHVADEIDADALRGEAPVPVAMSKGLSGHAFPY